MKKYKLFEVIDDKIVERYIKGNPDPEKYAKLDFWYNVELSETFGNIISIEDFNKVEKDYIPKILISRL